MPRYNSPCSWMIYRWACAVRLFVLMWIPGPGMMSQSNILKPYSCWKLWAIVDFGPDHHEWKKYQQWSTTHKTTDVQLSDLSSIWCVSVWWSGCGGGLKCGLYVANPHMYIQRKRERLPTMIMHSKSYEWMSDNNNWNEVVGRTPHLVRKYEWMGEDFDYCCVFFLFLRNQSHPCVDSKNVCLKKLCHLSFCCCWICIYVELELRQKL